MVNYTFDKNLNLKIKKNNLITKKKGDKLPLVNYADIGYYIITPLLIGVFLGLTVDRFFKTKSIFFLIFLFFGVIAAFYNMYKIYKDGK